MRLRVATWNLDSCVGTDRRLDPARSAGVLTALDADVIGLQEVDGRHPPVERLEQLAFLARRLGMQSLAGPNLRDERGEYGNALLWRPDRIACARDERVDLSVPGRETRGAIDATLQIDAKPLRVVVTHLGLRRAERARQILVLRERLAKDAGVLAPTLLIGDLNDWRPARALDRLVPDCFPVVSTVRTFPSSFPSLRLDRILVRPTPSRFASRAVATPAARRASDHLPLVADVEWS